MANADQTGPWLVYIDFSVTFWGKRGEVERVPPPVHVVRPIIPQIPGLAESVSDADLEDMTPLLEYN